MKAAQTALVDGRRRAINYHATQLAADMASEAGRLHDAAERMAGLSRELVEYKNTVEVTYTG